MRGRLGGNLVSIKNVLKQDDLHNFELFAELQGYTAIPTIGEFELLRMVKKSTKPIIIYKSKNIEYSSFEFNLLGMVSEFYRENGDS
jgi:hypothetical protein